MKNQTIVETNDLVNQKDRELSKLQRTLVRICVLSLCANFLKQFQFLNLVSLCVLLNEWFDNIIQYHMHGQNVSMEANFENFKNPAGFENKIFKIPHTQ